MRFDFRLFGALLAASVLSFSGLSTACARETILPKADLVLLGGQVYTVDAARSWAEAVAIAKGKIIFVGSDSQAKSFIGNGTRVVDLDGKMVLPGLHDCHVHLCDGGRQLTECRLEQANSQAEIVSSVQKYAAEHNDDQWVRGTGWSLPLFKDANPSKAILDQVLPSRPVFLASQDEHSAWVNSCALKLANITRDTPDPPLGRIERDPVTHEPTGTLRESAVELVRKLIPVMPLDKRVAALKNAQTIANGFGITSIQDAYADETVLDTYAELQRLKQLNLKVVACLAVDPKKDANQLGDLVKQRTKYTTGRLRATSAKMFADGVIETHTASLLEPYSDKPDVRGIANYSEDLMNSLVKVLDLSGFQVHIHAIGDAAVRQALNAFAVARKASGSNDSRHHIAHLELMSDTDIARFMSLGVTANFQPFWMYHDPYITECTEPLLGPERSARLYQINSVFKSGANVACGSDWPVSTLNPLDAIEVATTRRALGDETNPSWLPEEQIQLTNAIAFYTINGAFVNHEEKSTGSIEEGKSADLIVLEHNLFTTAPAKIHETKVLWTLLDGEEVYRNDAFMPQNIALQSK